MQNKLITIRKNHFKMLLYHMHHCNFAIYKVSDDFTSISKVFYQTIPRYGDPTRDKMLSADGSTVGLFGGSNLTQFEVFISQT